MEQVRRRGLETVLGLALVVALVAAVVVVYKSFRGDFGSDVVVTATISQAGDALEQGDIVTFRDVIVGEVTSASGRVDGSAALRLKIHRSAADVIPANVQALAVPQSLFGSTKIVLVPPAHLSGASAPTLREGTAIRADDSPAAESLQTALSKAYTLLTAVHPAQLDVALSALATALDGQGENLGTLVSRVDGYLRRLAPHLPEVDAVVTGLADVTEQLARNAPALLDSLSNVLVTSKAILADRAAVAELLAVAPSAVDDAQRLFSSANIDNAVTVLADQTAVLRAFADNPRALPDSINGFKTFADTLASTVHGRSVAVDLILTGVNLAEIPTIVVGGKGELFKAITDPAPYSAAQCPRYPGAAGPNCARAAAPATGSTVLLTSGSNYGGTSSSVGSPDEQTAVSGAAGAITGVPAGRQPAVTDLLLGPLLRGSPTVIR